MVSRLKALSRVLVLHRFMLSAGLSTAAGIILRSLVPIPVTNPVFRYVGLPGRRRDFSRPVPRESSAMPSDHCLGANDVQTTAPTGPPLREHDPQEPVGALQAQTKRRVLSENGELVTKCEDLRLQGDAGSKTGGYQSEKGDEKRGHRDTAMISRMLGISAFSARTEFSVTTPSYRFVRGRIRER